MSLRGNCYGLGNGQIYLTQRWRGWWVNAFNQVLRLFLMSSATDILHASRWCMTCVSPLCRDCRRGWCHNKESAPLGDIWHMSLSSTSSVFNALANIRDFMCQASAWDRCGGEDGIRTSLCRGLGFSCGLRTTFRCLECVFRLLLWCQSPSILKVLTTDLLLAVTGRLI